MCAPFPASAVFLSYGMLHSEIQLFQYQLLRNAAIAGNGAHNTLNIFKSHYNLEQCSICKLFVSSCCRLAERALGLSARWIICQLKKSMLVFTF